MVSCFGDLEAQQLIYVYIAFVTLESLAPTSSLANTLKICFSANQSVRFGSQGDKDSEVSSINRCLQS